MSAIVPSRRSAVTSRRFARSGRKLVAALGHAPRFSAAQLAEIEARYADLLAAEPTAVEGCALTEPVEVTIGRPQCDQTTIGAQIAMWSGRGAQREFIVTAHVTDLPVELTPRQAREAAESLRRMAAALDALAADAEALAEIEAEH